MFLNDETMITHFLTDIIGFKLNHVRIVLNLSELLSDSFFIREFL